MLVLLKHFDCRGAATNFTLKPARYEDPIGCLHWVTVHEGNKIATRVREALRFKLKHPLTPYAKSLLDEQKALCATTKYSFRETGTDMYLVTNVKNAHSCAVTWNVQIEDQWSCVCSSWIEFRLICRHILVVMKHRKIKPLTPANVALYWPKWARSASYHEGYRAAGGVR